MEEIRKEIFDDIKALNDVLDSDSFSDESDNIESKIYTNIEIVTPGIIENSNNITNDEDTTKIHANTYDEYKSTYTTLENSKAYNDSQNNSANKYDKFSWIEDNYGKDKNMEYMTSNIG